MAQGHLEDLRRKAIFKTYKHFEELFKDIRLLVTFGRIEKVELGTQPDWRFPYKKYVKNRTLRSIVGNMERSKKTKLYFHDTRSKVESTKEDHKPKSSSPLEERNELQTLSVNKWNHDPMDVDSTKRESSNQAS